MMENPETAARILFALVFFLAGGFLIWGAGEAARGGMRRAGVVGIRWPRHLISGTCWVAAHRASRRPTELAGAAFIAAGAAGGLPVTMPTYSVLVLLGVIGGTVFLIKASNTATRVVREHAREPPPEDP